MVEFGTNDENYLGYVSVTKILVKIKVFELFKNEPDSPVLKEQILNKEMPFVVRICEFRADLLERNSYGTNEDYRRNEIFRFADLLQVGSFLAALNVQFEDLKWFSEFGLINRVIHLTVP